MEGNDLGSLHCQNHSFLPIYVSHPLMKEGRGGGGERHIPGISTPRKPRAGRLHKEGHDPFPWFCSGRSVWRSYRAMARYSRPARGTAHDQGDLSCSSYEQVNDVGCCAWFKKKKKNHQGPGRMRHSPEHGERVQGIPEGGDIADHKSLWSHTHTHTRACAHTRTRATCMKVVWMCPQGHTRTHKRTCVHSLASTHCQHTRPPPAPSRTQQPAACNTDTQVQHLQSIGGVLTTTGSHMLMYTN